MVIHKFPIRPEFIELLIGLAAGLILLAVSRLRLGSIERVALVIRRTARRGILWIAVAALLGPCIRLALLPLAPIPYPAIHDEFCHLLGADTMLNCRLANPPHRFSDHFETIYVIQSPSYAESYPPGIAAFLAIGWKVAGHPWFGVWLSMVLCLASMAWLQYRWLPPVAAWAGSLLCSLYLGISSQWMNTYWGGGVPAAGGALVFGALPPLLRTARVRYAAIIAAGWMLIWFSRPYESVIVGLIIAAAILSNVRKLLPSALLLSGTIAVAFAGFCYYNWRVTGDPLIHPYQLTQMRYGVPHPLIWQNENPVPTHVNRQQWDIYVWQRDRFRQARSLATRGPMLLADLKGVWSFYLGYPLTIPLLIALFGGGRKSRRMVWIVGIGLAWSLLYTQIQPHYLAPVAGLLFALVALGLLKLSYWRWRALPLGACLAAGLWTGSALSGLRVLHPWVLTGGPARLTDRAAVAQQLEHAEGRHLVIVRYGPHHNAHVPWVYNAAAIDQSKVVWANDLGLERNRPLMEYFAGRRVWLVEPDGDTQLKPYPDSAAELLPSRERQ